MSRKRGWIGVDLDGTLAHYEGWKGPSHIGAPIPAMVGRVLRWLAEEREVRILTARVAVSDRQDQRQVDLARVAIDAWCQEHLGRLMVVTCRKDQEMVELWDDRCVAVEKNTGRQLTQSEVEGEVESAGYERLLRAAARCATCQAPATCLGRYEDMEHPEFGCDDHCGHGNEDGHCEQLPWVDR